MTSIRDMRLADDKPALLSFIDGSQAFEHNVEPNRRLDRTVAEDYLAELLNAVTERGGKVFVAQDTAGAAVGWGVVYVSNEEIFVVERERRFAYISELFVVESLRGKGIGRALIASCEDWARAHGIGIIQLGVLAGNVRARTIYSLSGYSDYALQLRKYLR